MSDQFPVKVRLCDNLCIEVSKVRSKRTGFLSFDVNTTDIVTTDVIQCDTTDVVRIWKKQQHK